MSSKSLLPTVNSKLHPIMQLFLLMHFSVPKTSIIIPITIITKFIGITIVTSNFIINPATASSCHILITQVLRKITMFHLFSKLPPPVYLVSCYVVYLLTFITIFFCWKNMRQMKHQRSKLKLQLFPKIMFFFIIIFGQHILEYLSLSLVILFRTKYTFTISPLYPQYQKYLLLIFPGDFNVGGILVTVLNSILYIALNAIIYFGFCLINSPSYCPLAVLTMRHHDYFMFFMIAMNYQALHYWEVLLSANGLIVFKSIVIVLLLLFLIGNILFTIYRYETKNYLYYFIQFMGIYNFISIILEFFITLHSYIFTTSEIIICLALKVLLSGILISYVNFFQKKYLRKSLNNLLFNPYDSNNFRQIIESYYYLLDTLIQIKLKDESIHCLIDIISIHQKGCVNDFCKCKIIQLFPEMTCDNKQFTSLLLYNIGFMIESTFINWNSYSNYFISLFISDYYFHIKGNHILAFSIIQSALIFSNKTRKYNSRDLLNLYYINQKYIGYFNEIFRLSPEKVYFETILTNIESKYDFFKNVIKYSHTFDSLVDIKISFENSLKFENDDDNGELKGVTSLLLNKEIIQQIISQLVSIYDLSIDIKKMLKTTSKEKRGIEYYYIIYLFYLFFERRIPSKLKMQLSSLTIRDSFIGLSLKETQMKFDKLLDNYLSLTSSINHIILKCSKGLIIKYFSSNLLNKLKFSQSSILGESFLSIFPKSIQEAHHQAILHLTMNKNAFFVKKKTYIFDSLDHSYPCHVNAGIMPTLSKRMLIICEITMKEKSEEDLSLILNDNYSGIAISEDVEKRYCVNLDLLKKADTELIEVFEITPRLLKDYFSKETEKAFQFKERTELCAISCYSNNLFYSADKNDYFGDITEKKFQLNQKSINVNLPQHSNPPQLSKDALFLSKVKSSITQNIIRTLGKLNDSPIKEEKLKQLSQTIISLKQTLSNLKNQSRTKLSVFKSKEFNPNSSIQSLKQLSSPLTLEYKIRIRLLFTMPLYIITITDPFIPEERCPLPNEMNSHINPSLLNKKPIIPIKKDYFLLDNILRKIPSLKKTNSKTKHIIFSKSSNEIVLLIITILIMFCLSLYILIGEIIGISKIIISIRFIFLSYFQRDAIINLESSLFTMAYELGNYTQMNITEDDFFYSLNASCDAVENSLVYFYKTLDIYNPLEAEDFYGILMNKTYTKVIIDWEMINYQSDYISEVNYLLYQSGMVLQEKNVIAIQKDINELFFHKFSDNNEKMINSPFGIIVFFMSVNIPKSLSGSMLEIMNKSILNLMGYLSGTQEMLMSLELITMAANILFYAIIIRLLNKYNYQLLKTIISMFFDKSSQKATSNFQNRLENTYMKQKIKYFIQLINNFNEDNKKILNNILQGNHLSANKEVSQGHFSNNTGMMIQMTNLNSFNTSVTHTQNSLNITNTYSINNSSANNITTNNLLVKHSDNTMIKRLVSTTNKSRQMKEGDSISTKSLIQMILKNRINLTGIFLLITYICLIINLGIAGVRLYNTLNYKSYAHEAIDIFTKFTDYLVSVPAFSNSIRNKILTKNENLQAYENISINLTKYEDGLIKATNRNFKQFEKSHVMWDQFNYKTTDPLFDSSLICNDEVICLKLLHDPNGLCADGIFLGYKVVLQTLKESVSNYKYLIANYPSYGQKELKDYVMTNDFNLAHKYIDFVFKMIQNLYYQSFYQDFTIYSNTIKEWTIYLNIAIFGVYLLSIIIILFSLIRRMIRRLYQVFFSSSRFNNAIYTSNGTEI